MLNHSSERKLNVLFHPLGMQVHLHTYAHFITTGRPRRDIYYLGETDLTVTLPKKTYQHACHLQRIR